MIDREQAARDTTACWWPGDKPHGKLWQAKGNILEAPYRPSALTWVLTLLAGAVIGWTVGPWVPLP